MGWRQWLGLSTMDAEVRPVGPIDGRGFHYATDGRDTMVNDPDGWEVDRPWLWWAGPAGSDGTGGPWGNPLPGATPDSGWAMPAVTRCTNLIAGTLAGLPWQVLRETGPDAAAERLPTPGWIADPQLLRPDARFGRIDEINRARLSNVDFYAEWVTSALWHGDGYVYAPVRAADGQPTPPVWLLHPHRIEIDAAGRYWTKAGLDVTGLAPPGPGGSPGWLPATEIPADQLIHLRGNPPYWGGHGTGIIDAAGSELGLASAVRSYAATQFNAGIPAGYLKVNAPQLTQEKATELKKDWTAVHGGRRGIAVLNATTDFVPIQLSPVDAQLDEARMASLRDVALAFGVPAWFLGVPGDASTYSNVESRFVELRTYTLLPWIRRIEATLDAQFPLGTSVKLKTAGLERGDTSTRFAEYNVALTAGFLTVNEVRALEDLPPLPEVELAAEPSTVDTPGNVSTVDGRSVAHLRRGAA